MHLTDYKVRVLNPEEATAAKVRVLIESTDGQDTWATVGVSTDIIEASCLALTDSIEYKLLKGMEQRHRSCYTTEGG
jgi:2-isopropylmalate synthase